MKAVTREDRMSLSRRFQEKAQIPNYQFPNLNQFPDPHNNKNQNQITFSTFLLKVLTLEIEG